MEPSSSAAAEVEVERAVAREKLLGARERRSGYACDIILRVFILPLTLAAVVVIASDQETEDVFVTLGPGLPGITAEVTAQFQASSSLVYFLVANGVAFVVTVFSLIVSIVNRGLRGGLTLLNLSLDAVVLAVLFASLGAVVDVGLIAYNGLKAAEWERICNVFDEFCNQAAAGFALSATASLLFFALVIYGGFALYRKII
ncbi:hypothetical protein M569_00163 [Genlisea aurea]|uniref:CASP-like protein n=1 Tax=Genlisea aurea TaxID=192259 RepID=S8EF09_9LAMI|nr:hypothetical protein M569_00163 [Genlisea aurea]